LRFDTMPSTPSLQACSNHRCAVEVAAVDPSIELRPRSGVSKQLAEIGLALLEWFAPQIAADQLDQIEGIETHMVISLAVPKQVEWWDPAVIARDRLAVDRAGWQLRHRL
jgi:hypothetical protein